MSTIQVGVGSGAVLPVNVSVTTTGAHDIASYGVPAGADVTLTLTGGGGGGASGDGTDHGGGGGGGAAGVIVVVPAALWAAGGELVIGTGGAGGLTGVHDGSNGVDSTLTMTGTEQVVAGKGLKGNSTSHLGGAGGTVTADPAFSVVAARKGSAGGTTTGLAAGPGGAAGIAPGGAGGAGGANAAGAGVAGSAGAALISWTPG